MVLLKDARVKWKISCQQHSISMMSGHWTNPVFFDKKIKTGSLEHCLIPNSLPPITSHFCLTPMPRSLMWTSYVYRPYVGPTILGKVYGTKWRNLPKLDRSRKV